MPQLQQVYVANIPTRFGQQLRLALQEQLGGGSQQVPEGYVIDVTPNLDASVLDIHTDNTAGRFREIGRARWALYALGAERQRLASGEASLLDGFNTTFEQYFAQTLNEETVRARLARGLARSIKDQLAVWFKSYHAPAQPRKRERSKYFDPNAMPTANGQPYENAGPDGFPASATGRTNINALQE